MNGVYWGLTALCIMGHPDALPREEMIDYVLSCWDDEAGELSIHLYNLRDVMLSSRAWSDG